MSDATQPSTDTVAADTVPTSARPLDRGGAAMQRTADPLASCLFALTAFYAAYTLAIALSPGVASFAMQRSHLAGHHFVRWAVFAPAPFMYNFENRVTVSAEPLTRHELELRPTASWLVLNHYPARALTYHDLRLRLFARPSHSYVYLESRYRGQRVRTSYRVVYTSQREQTVGSVERWEVSSPPRTPSPVEEGP